MKTKKSIWIDSSVNYLNEALTELPTNCIFDKGKVGAGGTTIALESKEAYVVAVPFKSLITNKVKQYPNTRYNGSIFGVDGNTKKKDLIAYLQTTETPKLMVTYDSLGKLANWIKPEDFKLLIDEMHLLFTQYSFRKEAAQTVLQNYTRFKEFCFMTATPLEDDFLLDELQDIDIVEAKWETVREVTVTSVKCNNAVSDTVAQLVNEFVTGVKDGNAYFFVNSVEFIKEMVEVCNLTDENTRAIWSTNNRTETGIKRGDTLDQPKKINFLTSTVFEGSDILDENGIIFIISDNRKSHTLIDISTSFQQIAGRIRNTKYWNQIIHIYTNTRYDINVNYEEFRNLTVSTIEDAKTFLNKINQNFTDKEKAQLLVANESYINKVDGVFFFDANLVKVDLYNFKVTKNLYKLRVNMKQEYNKYGFNVDEYEHNAYPITRMDILKPSFKEIVEQMETERNNFELYIAAYKKYSFLEDAIRILGFEGIKNCGYIITNVKSKLIVKADIGQETKIFKLLKTKLNISTGDFLSAKKSKEVFTAIYKELGIKKTAKGTDIDIYFEANESSKRINNKKETGFIIIRPKIIFTCND
jgi:hypothetical protein